MSLPGLKSVVSDDHMEAASSADLIQPARSSTSDFDMNKIGSLHAESPYRTLTVDNSNKSSNRGGSGGRNRRPGERTNWWNWKALGNFLSCCKKAPKNIPRVEEESVSIYHPEGPCGDEPASSSLKQDNLTITRVNEHGRIVLRKMPAVNNLNAISEENIVDASASLSAIVIHEDATKKRIFKITENELTFNGNQLSINLNESGISEALCSSSESPRSVRITSLNGCQVITLISLRNDLSTSLGRLILTQCNFSLVQLTSLLVRCKNLEELRLQTSHFYYQDGIAIGSSTDLSSMKSYRRLIDHNLKDAQEPSGPSPLKRLSLDTPYVKGCSVICCVIERVFKFLTLESFEVRCSQQKMIEMLAQVTQEKLDENVIISLIKFDCQSVLSGSLDSLKELKISCQDQFPLSWIQNLSSENGTKLEMGTLFQFKYQLTGGLLDTLIPCGESMSPPKFPNLTVLHLNFPILKVVPSYVENKECEEMHESLRRYLLAVEAFLGVNMLKLKELKLDGLRPSKTMIPYMNQYFSAQNGGRTHHGVFYLSSEIEGELHQFGEEIRSLALLLDKEEFDGNVNRLLNYSLEMTDVNLPSVRTLHLVNRLPTLKSLSVTCLTQKFKLLSTLIIEDYNFILKSKSDNPGGDTCPSNQSAAKIRNEDIWMLVRKLNRTLRVLHLHCDMLEVTDKGFIGPVDNEKRMFTSVRSDKSVSLTQLTALQYIYLRGLGDKVTDAAAKLCFAEAFSLPRLTELHLFAPKITAIGKSLIRQNYESRVDFVLELE